MFQGGPTVMMELQVTVAFGAFKYLFQQKSMSDIEKEYQGDGGSDDHNMISLFIPARHLLSNN
jgi:hypothetical protein